MNMDRMLTVKEAAEKIGVSVQAVYKRIKQGTIDAVQINHRWLINGGEEGSVLIALPAGRPRKGEPYVLMNGNYPVMEFNYREQSNDFKIFNVIDAARAPLGCVTQAGNGNNDALKDWWDHRSIPGSRAGLDAKLAQLGLESPEQIPFRNLGLSLSDQYWIRPAHDDISWNSINYFENDFGPKTEVTGSTVEGNTPAWDAWLAQVGLDSPDNTSEGALPKRWICQDGKRLLLKGCNPWTDQQPVNELVATALHKRLLDAKDYVEYSLVEDAKGDPVASSCPCFVTKDEEYIPASRLLATQGKRQGEPDYNAYLRICRNMGMRVKDVETALSKMIVCDSIIANNDRHLRNFGLVRDIDTLALRCAPLFDSGNSLWFDKDESAVAQRNWSFTSLPFDATPNRQLYLAGRMEWLDPQTLDGFVEEAASILEKSVFALPRLDYILEGIRRRIDAVLGMRG